MGRTTTGQVSRLRCQRRRGAVPRGQVSRRRGSRRRNRFIILVVISEVMRRTASSQAISPIGQGSEPTSVASQTAVGVVSGGIVVGHHGRTLALVQEAAGVSRAAVFALRFRLHVGGRPGTQGGGRRRRSVFGALVSLVVASVVAGGTGVATGAGFFAGGLPRISVGSFPSLDSAQ